jgi:hypothetical protein
MSEAIYEYDSYSSASNWSNPGYAIDGDNDQYASSTHKQDPESDPLVLDATDAPGTDLGTITKVELGINGLVAGDGVNCEYYARARINGSDPYDFPGLPSEVAGDPDATVWNDITSEGLGWSDFPTATTNITIYEHDCWGTESIIALYVDVVYIKVTYTEAATGPADIDKVNSISSTDIDKVEGIDYGDITKINTVA